MNLNKICPVIILISIISSCNYLEEKKYEKYIKKNVERLYESELILPVSIKNLENITLPESFYSNLYKYQIISLVDGNCQTCIRSLQIWEEDIIQRLNPNYVNFIFIICTDDYEYFKKIIFPDITFNFPIFIDTSNVFVEVNELYMLEKYLLTFLIDTEGKIKLIGNPLMNNELQALYFQEINKLNQNKQ